tara:strand:+ start:42 stop:452 length:411 start_codon:yes stop_codon:yes gene_type:complete
MTWLSNIVNNKRVGSSVAKCWKGYQRVSGTTEFSDGSCEKSPTKMTDEEYDKKNAKMRRDHASGVTYTSPTKLASQQKSGTGSARISFAARFGGQGHSMTEKDGSPSGYAHALKRWGFSSGAQATAFANKHKKKDV